MRKCWTHNSRVDQAVVPVGGGRARPGLEIDHSEPHISAKAPLVCRAPEGPEGLAAVPVGGGGAWPEHKTTRQASHQHTRPHWCGGRRRDRRARAGFEARRRTQ